MIRKPATSRRTVHAPNHSAASPAVARPAACGAPNISELPGQGIHGNEPAARSRSAAAPTSAPKARDVVIGTRTWQHDAISPKHQRIAAAPVAA